MRFIGLFILVLLLIVGLIYSFTHLVNSIDTETDIQTVTIYKTETVIDLVHAQTTVFVPSEPVIKTVHHEVIRWIDREVEIDVPRPYQKWDSVEQFTEWCESQEWTFIFPNGENAADTADCDDYSERLQKVALRGGYPVSQALVSKGLYFGISVRDGLEPHAGNLVEIAGTYYYVEPHPRDMIMVRITVRD